MTGYESKKKAAQEKLAQPAQEPVAWMYQHPNNHRKTCYQTYKPSGECTPLYTAPPQRPWVGLTAQEAAECWTTSATQTWKNFEAKLKDKNNG